MSTATTNSGDARSEKLLETISDLVINGNLEFSAGSPQQIAEAAEILPRSIGVYVPSLPGKSYSELLERLNELKAAGFDPIPHIAARRVPSRKELADYLRTATEDLGVKRIMLIGGDSKHAAGPYSDAVELLEDGVLAEHNITEAGIAGYPEGHPKIPEDVLLQALIRKLELAKQQNIEAEIVTQFCFNPNRIIDYSTRISEIAPDTPIFVGMAGPSNAKTLLRFAKQCGVSTSLRGLVNMGVDAARLFSNADPSKQLTKLAAYYANHNSNIIGIHVFSFGGFIESAKWMRQQATSPQQT